MRFLVLLLLICISAPLKAQAPGGGAAPKAGAKTGKKKAKKDDSERPVDLNRLPAPFDRVLSNGLELQGKRKLLTLMSVKYEFLKTGRGKGIVWTLKANRDVTFRRLKQHLADYRDARFYYRTRRNTLIQKFHTQLNYPSIIDAGADNSERMLSQQVFQVWIPMTDTERRKVIAQESNFLVLKRPFKRP